MDVAAQEKEDLRVKASDKVHSRLYGNKLPEVEHHHQEGFDVDPPGSDVVRVNAARSPSSLRKPHADSVVSIRILGLHLLQVPVSCQKKINKNFGNKCPFRPSSDG